MKSLEPHKNYKNQPRPLVRPSSVNFCQNFWNLSHETVPLRDSFKECFTSDFPPGTGYYTLQLGPLQIFWKFAEDNTGDNNPGGKKEKFFNRTVTVADFTLADRFFKDIMLLLSLLTTCVVDLCSNLPQSLFTQVVISMLYRTSGVIFFIDYCTAIRDTWKEQWEEKETSC